MPCSTEHHTLHTLFHRDHSLHTLLHRTQQFTHLGTHSYTFQEQAGQHNGSVLGHGCLCNIIHTEIVCHIQWHWWRWWWQCRQGQCLCWLGITQSHVVIGKVLFQQHPENKRHTYPFYVSHCPKNSNTKWKLGFFCLFLICLKLGGAFFSFIMEGHLK